VSSIQNSIEKVLELSKADDCIVIGEEASIANVRWANSSSTTNGMASTKGMQIISVIDKRVGSVSRSYFPEDRLEELVRESEAACDGKPEAQDFMPLVTDGATAPDWDLESEPTDISVLGDLSSDLSGLFDAARAEDLLLFGFARHSATTRYLATSAGVRRRYTQHAGKVDLNTKTPDFKKSVWAGAVTKNFKDVHMDGMYKKCLQRIGWSQKTVDLPAGRYEVLLEPSSVASMLLLAYLSMNARDADEGRSVFSKPGGGNRLGEKIFPDFVSIYSDPAEPSMETTPFEIAPASGRRASVFDNGLGISKTNWVESGTLERLVTTRHWADKSGATATPAVGNMVFESEGADLDAMIASSKRALLVACLWYIRTVDPRTLLLTGLTRDGVFLVEDGEVRGAVNNFRFNMSPVDMLAQSLEAGASEPGLAREGGDFFPFAKVPPLRVDRFNMSSVSEAT
jgi:predicted Zn-dependent protease